MNRIRTGGASSFPVHNKFHTHSLSSLLDPSVSLLLAVATNRTSILLCIPSCFVDVVCDQTIQNLTAPSDMRFHLNTRDQIPSGNEWKMEAENFEWHGSLPGHPRVVLSFALDSLTLSGLHVNIAHFPYPPPNSKSRVDSLEPPGWTLFSASGSLHFAAASMSQGRVHPEKALVVDPDDYPLPPHIIRWPDTSPGRASNLPLATEAERFPVPQWLSPKARALYEQGPVFLTTSECFLDDRHS